MNEEERQELEERQGLQGLQGLQKLRDSLRLARRNLTAAQQTGAAQALTDRIAALDFFVNASKIAFYSSFDGEVDASPLLNLALAEGKSCFLPIITGQGPDLISFAPYDNATELTENQWGIAEPPAASLFPATSLDVAFVPLVGFDAQCFRLGLGKGFYDRTFSFKILNRRRRPLLIGLAHECQLTDTLPAASWDVRLDAVITGGKTYRPDTA